MRRLFLPAVLLLALAACSAGLQGPGQPIAAEQIGPGLGLDIATAREAAISFLDAYAHATEDHGARLAAIVVGPRLRAWVHWLDVQNREFDGTITGALDVRSVEFVDTFLVQTAIGSRVDVGASVTFTYHPAGGSPFQRVRIMDGPVALLESGAATWKVVDATRDGQSMDGGIQLFQDVSQSKGGVMVSLRSLFMFTPNWQFNVVVTNRSGHVIRLDPTGVGLDVRETAGSTKRTKGASTDALAEVPSGGGVEGLLAFPGQDSAAGRTLSIAYRSAGQTVRFGFRLERLVTQAPSTTPGPSPSPST